MKYAFLLAAVLVLAGCSPAPHPPSTGLFYWKTTLSWTEKDSERMAASGVDRIGLRLFDWGPRGEEGPLAVQRAIPPGIAVVPVIYVTTACLEQWASSPQFDPAQAARTVLSHGDRTLARAWSGGPDTWLLDADWTATTGPRWFAVVGAFRDAVHGRGGRLEVTVRLHQYRDRSAQGVPPADGGVLMLYGVGDPILDLTTVQAYLQGPPYPLPLTPAFPAYTQVRQFNGYSRLVGLLRVTSDEDLPLVDLEPLADGRFRVLRRAVLGNQTLLAHDELAVDRVDPAVLASVTNLPAVRALAAGSGDRRWVFDYDSQGWEALIHGPLAPYLFVR